MNRHENETVRAALRAGDPAADGREPTAEEVARLRTRVVEEAALLDPPCLPDETTPHPAWSRAAAAVAALFLVAVLAVVAGRAGWLPPALSGTPAPEEASLPDGTEAAEEPRQIQFTTPGGTRVVWMLYPEDPTPSTRARRDPGGTS